MFFGIQQLRRAADLASGGGDPARLSDAMFSFRSACACRWDWPAEFRDRAEDILRLTSDGGVIRSTVETMGESRRAEFRERVRRLVEDAERYAASVQHPHG